jgi:hypothetical protein
MKNGADIDGEMNDREAECCAPGTDGETLRKMGTAAFMRPFPGIRVAAKD